MVGRRESLSGDSLEAQLAGMEGDRDMIESERMRLELRARLFGDAAMPTQVDRFTVLRLSRSPSFAPTARAGGRWTLSFGSR